jgi:hypothetical protein
MQEQNKIKKEKNLINISLFVFFRVILHNGNNNQ